MSMYDNIKPRVKLNNKLSQEFSCMTGVRRGKCLSPFLFALYVNYLEQELITRGGDGVDTDLLKLSYSYMRMTSYYFPKLLVVY